MKNLICCTAKYSIGATFLDWSVNYLSGQTKFLNKELGWIDLVDNPLSKINAHGHRKNHPRGFKQTIECASYLLENADFSTIYPFHMGEKSAADNLGIDSRTMSSSIDLQKKIIKFRDNDYNQLLNWLDNQGSKIIYISSGNAIPLYVNCETRTITKTKDELQKEFDEMYFVDSKNKWGKTNSVSDLRERMALDYRPFGMDEENVDLSINHFWIDCQLLWFDLDNIVYELFQWLELDIHQQRYIKWKPVYENWRRLQAKFLSFQRNYQHIVDSIVNGWSYPIDLTFEQEVVIQHCLIYQHNLNLKTWKLDKFPNNTKDLHALLEPNIHPVPKIY